MGRTKWYSDPESNRQQGGRNQASGSRSRKNSIIRGSFVHHANAPLDTREWVRQIVLKIRRNWVAFRFQLNRMTFGTFQKQGILKLGFLVVAGYGLLFYEKGSSLSFFSSKGEPTAMETKLDLAPSRGINRSSRIAKPASKPAVAKPVREKSDVAPVRVSEIADASSAQYIQRFAPIARKEMGKYGVPASISLAQGLIESRAGTSKLAKLNNNHFGMKCFLKNCKSGHCSNYSDDSHKDFFRIFKNPWDCWRAHSEMISTGRYTKLKKYGHDYRKWAYGLKSVGYATDQNYANKLIGVIERLQLYRYDK